MRDVGGMLDVGGMRDVRNFLAVLVRFMYIGLTNCLALGILVSLAYDSVTVTAGGLWI